MTQDEAFLEAIREQPDDDAPRLIYADWLEEHGGHACSVRAQFIPVQCEPEQQRHHDRRGCCLPSKQLMEAPDLTRIARQQYS
jgi:uncharacterized protein (TIGR02996 family)